MQLTKTFLSGTLADFARRSAKRVGGSKTLLVVKLVTIFMLAAVLQVSASGSAQTVTYSATNVPLTKVLSVIEKQTGYAVFYRKQDIKNTPPVNISLNKADLQTALTELLKDQQLEFQIEENTVFIRPKLFSVGQNNLTGLWRMKEERSIKGTSYENGIPRLIEIQQEDKRILFKETSSLGESDTITSTELKYQPDQINETITKTGRKKETAFYWDEKLKAWVRRTEYSSKTYHDRAAIVMTETFVISTSGDELIFNRNYDELGELSSDRDFIMEGVFEKTTPEKLAYDTTKGRGVQFVEGLTWEQVKAKAKKEKKYIFVDCYATWCGPCKAMDKDVYPLNRVGDVMNNKFIAVKLQMDSTTNDAQYIKILYPTARVFENTYDISALPTYLFFSPDGNIVHKAKGQQNVDGFVKLAIDAMQPDKQLYRLIEKLKAGKLPYSDYPALAAKLKGESEESLALEVAKKYKENYLDKLSERELLRKDHLDFIGEYFKLITSTDKFFSLCYKQPALVDKIKEYSAGGWADFQVRQTILREDIQPFIQQAEQINKEPAWEKLELTLTKKYDKELAITYTLDTRVNWYKKKEQWSHYLQYIPLQLARYDLNKVNGAQLNTAAWKVFQHSQNTDLMRQALKWIDVAIEKTPKDLLWMTMDTKACLLYKMGQTREAIELEQKIIKLFPEFVKNFQPTLEKMKNGEKL